MAENQDDNTVDPSKIPDDNRPTLTSFVLLESFKWGMVLLGIYLFIVGVIIPIWQNFVVPFWQRLMIVFGFE